MRPIGILRGQYKGRELIEQRLRHHDDGSCPKTRMILWCQEHGQAQTVKTDDDRVADWLLTHPAEWCRECCNGDV